MSLFVWILLGLVSGFIASHLVNHRGEGIVLDVLLGVVGAIIGGWVFHLFRHFGVTGLNLYSTESLQHSGGDRWGRRIFDPVPHHTPNA
jgi:uncharacterized membrane protein YeaQ/YmgE (transglycosylase-associated protein family)